MQNSFSESLFRIFVQFASLHPHKKQFIHESVCQQLVFSYSFLLSFLTVIVLYTIPAYHLCTGGLIVPNISKSHRITVENKGADPFHAKILFYICTGANGF